MVVIARRPNHGPALVRELRLVLSKALMDKHWDRQEGIAANTAYLLLTGVLGSRSVLVLLHLSLLGQGNTWQHCNGTNAGSHKS
jgi:hypothetical protein